MHSGQKGGPVPDPAQILCRLIAGLTADGRIARRSRPLPAAWSARPRDSGRASGGCPSTRRSSRAQAGLLPGVRLAGEKAYSPFERIWTRPSLTVIALESQPILGSSNQIVDSARARLSMRTVPHMDSREAGELLIRKLTRNPPHGAHVDARGSSAARPGGRPIPKVRPSTRRAGRSRRASARTR